MRSVQLDLSDQQVNKLKDFLESGSRRMRHVLETMFSYPVKNHSFRLEIIDARSLLEVADFRTDSVSFRTDSMVVVESDLHGDLHGRLLLMMRSRDFHAVCELITMAMPYLVNTRITTEHLESTVPDWVKMNEAEYVGSAAFHKMTFDSVAELGNIIFGGFLTSAYEIFGVSTYHSVPKAKLDKEKTTIFNMTQDDSKTKHPLLFTENHFVMLPFDFKLWFLMLPENKTFEKFCTK